MKLNKAQIYNILKPLDEHCPSPTEAEEVADYLNRILKERPNLKDHVLTKADTQDLVPQGEARKRGQSWKEKELKLREFLQKPNDPKIQIVQCLDGSAYGRFSLTPTQMEIYKKSNDYSLAIILGEIIERHVSKVDHDAIMSLIIENLPLLNADGHLFHEAILSDLKDVSHDKQNAYKQILIAVIQDFTDKGTAQLLIIDKQKNLISDDKALSPGVSFRYPIGHDESIRVSGMLITTSNGGGCHKQIAETTISGLNGQGIACGLINESVLTGEDPLNAFVGIAFSDLYPIVFQQYGQKECRALLSGIFSSLTQNFMPQSRFAQLRKAIAQCNEIMQVSCVYSTQHFAEDLRIVPQGSSIIFQVCDYGEMVQLKEVAELAAKVPASDNVKFLIPSETCIPGSLAQKDITIFETCVYPTVILNHDQSQDLFRKFTEGNGLHSPDEKDVLRCAIVMGGQGCGELIERYVNNILAQVKSAPPDAKMEFVVACGNNAQLKAELEAKFKDAFPPNVKIKFCGFIPNQELIAYNKNAVLITKPGGGTISECIQNRIQTLVHYDPAHHWEQGNAIQIEIKKLGKIVGFESGGQILQFIQEGMGQIAFRKKEEVERNHIFHQTLAKQISELSGPLEKENSKPVERRENQLIAALAAVQDKLGKLDKQHVNDKDTLILLSEIKRIVKDHASSPAMQALQPFLNQYNITPTPESVLREKIATKRT